MKISLRPHHFLCLQGYKGFNYNKQQAQLWNKISKFLAENPDTDIFIIKGKDDLCQKCFLEGAASSSCLEVTVNSIDTQIKNLLDIQEGQTYKYSKIIEKLRKLMTQDKHKKLCSNCAWWKKGLCKDSFEIH